MKEPEGNLVVESRSFVIERVSNNAFPRFSANSGPNIFTLRDISLEMIGLSDLNVKN